MQLSSGSIAQLAGALAKAQSELVNPAKALTGTVVSGQRTGQTYRYASLASGLEIVRSVLGKQELAVIQTTAIDNERGTVSLTTTLAHSSGEWVAATWPVCRTADLQSPKWMGAALTYARRYGLFTLVGIAGEDDLDAPELDQSKVQADEASPPAGVATAPVHAGSGATDPALPRARYRTIKVSVPRAVLSETESAADRDRLMAELNELKSAEDIAVWAKRILPGKNSLTAQDARILEQAFEARMVALRSQELGSKDQSETPETASPDKPELPSCENESVQANPIGPARPIRRRDKQHLKFVAVNRRATLTP